jgi:hypothetical protein
MKSMKQLRNGELSRLSDGEVNGGIAPEGFAECFRRAPGEDNECVRARPFSLPCGVQAAVFGFSGNGTTVNHGDITGCPEWSRRITSRLEVRGHGGGLSLIETAPDGFE